MKKYRNICLLLFLLELSALSFPHNRPFCKELPPVKTHMSTDWKNTQYKTFSSKDTVRSFHSGHLVKIIRRRRHRQNLSWYTLKNKNVVVKKGIITGCSYNFAHTNIVIPKRLDFQTIKGIANRSTNDFNSGVFEENGITGVKLPSTIEFIGKNSFAGNNISSVNFSNTANLTTIGKGAFENNNIDTVLLPTNIRKIEASAFASNNLSKLDFKDCNCLSIIEKGAFKNNSIKTLTFSNCTRLYSIGKSAFENNQINDVNLNQCKNLRLIHSYAFHNNPIQSFTLPTPSIKGFTKWEDNKLNSYSAGDIVSNTSSYYRAIYPYILSDRDVTVRWGEIKYAGTQFLISNLIIPQVLEDQKIYSIGNALSPEKSSPKKWRITTGIIVGLSRSGLKPMGVFANGYIRSVAFPETIKYIGDYAFQNNLISSVDLSLCDSLSSIRDFAFSGNVLRNLDLSNCTNLKSIEREAFSNNKISGINLDNCINLIYIGEKAFQNNRLSDFKLPTPSVSGKEFLYWKNRSGDTYKAGERVINFDTDYKAIFK